MGEMVYIVLRQERINCKVVPQVVTVTKTYKRALEVFENDRKRDEIAYGIIYETKLKESYVFQSGSALYVTEEIVAKELEP